MTIKTERQTRIESETKYARTLRQVGNDKVKNG